MGYAYKTDVTSLMALHSQTGLSPCDAMQMEIPKAGGGTEVLYITPYIYGVCMEFAGLLESTVVEKSYRLNYRYLSSKPKTYGLGVPVWYGDRLDTGGLLIQHVGTLRVDGSNNYVTDPETGQPYLDDKAVEITCRTFREDGGLSHGDMRFINRGYKDAFEFWLGPKGSEEKPVRIDACGLHIHGQNVLKKMIELENRLEALE